MNSTRHSEARDRSPRREKETTGNKLKAKHNDSSLSIKTENKGDETVQTAKVKKEDPVKNGLEELQRILPHLGSPGEEKVKLDKKV